MTDEEELAVKFEILRLLKPLNSGTRTRVMAAASHLLEADRLITGVLDAFIKGGLTKQETRT